MPHRFIVSIVTLLLLLPAIALAAPAHKRKAQRWQGYGFLWHYFGQPGFYRGHYNGGSFGPCWTRTPVGMVWTCG